MKKIPYEIIDFKHLIDDGYYYVDKTMFLEKIENTSDALFYLRPENFGKSLFTSMMFYYYDVNSKDLFDSLFKDTYVYNNPTKNKNNYYILKFDFSIMNTSKEIINEFDNAVLIGLKRFNSYYNTNIEIKEDSSANVMLMRFLSSFDVSNLDKKIYIIINSYDNYINALFEENEEGFYEAMNDRGVVKAFYSVIKQRMGTVIGRTFITGICPISLLTLSGGFNIATDISTDLNFNEMAGFTHKEVKKLLEEFVDLKDRDNIYNVMVKNCYGYLFSKNAKERVFNATSIMYLLNYYKRFKEIPDKVIDKSDKLSDLLTLKNNTFYKELLNKINLSEKIYGRLKKIFDLTLNIDENDIISLLYYFGYLTIDTDYYGRYYFKMPNEVTKVLLEGLNENKFF